MAATMQGNHQPDRSSSPASPSGEDVSRLTRRSPYHPYVDAAGCIQHDYTCFQCGYNLRGISQEGGCPECGKAIYSTVAHRELFHGNKWHLRSFPILARLGYAFLGLILPAVCFTLAFMRSPIAPDWQDNFWTGTIAMLYGGWPLVVFFPLLFYAMFCFLLMLIRPLHFGQMFTIRFGVYSGVALALHYLTVLCMAAGWGAFMLLPGALMAAVFALFVFILFGSMMQWYWLGSATFKHVSHIILAILVGVIFMGITVDIMLFSGSVTVSLLSLTALLLLIGAPGWTLVVYVLLSLRTYWTDYPPCTPTQRHILGGTWLGIWCASKVIAIHRAIQEYEKLPTTPPGGCYIATAAAKGHRWLVGARPVHCADGSILLVNNQLRLCKVAELALRAAYPSVHRVLRKLYDYLGPPIARRLHRPLMADMAYLVLLPATLLITLFLHCLGVDVKQLMRRVYGNVTQDSSSSDDQCRA